SYEHGFVKKCDGHKLCAKSSLDHFSRTISEFQNTTIPNVFAHGKSYEHGFMKKHDGHKLCAKSSFDRFFTRHLRISKY
ncbi:hypothetical protein BHE74_00025790, partial [Ensete ventricosum]